MRELDVTIKEFILAGWELVQPISTPRALGRSLPDRIITISDCIADDLPRPEFWDWFQGRNEAERQATNLPDAQVVAIALTPADAADLMSAHGSPGQPWFRLLRDSHAVPLDASLLGFEVVGAEDELDFHSWHCHGYADDVASTLGIRTNEVGLLSTERDARRVITWMRERPDADAPRPVDWTVVALLSVAVTTRLIVKQT